MRTPLIHYKNRSFESPDARDLTDNERDCLLGKGIMYACQASDLGELPPPGWCGRNHAVRTYHLVDSVNWPQMELELKLLAARIVLGTLLDTVGRGLDKFYETLEDHIDDHDHWKRVVGKLERLDDILS